MDRSDAPNIQIVGKIKGAHGLKGFVRVRSYMDPPVNLKNYNAVYISKDEGLSWASPLEFDLRSNNKDLFNEQRIRTKNGMLTRDNVFGSLTDDSIRRDLSVNAFYYDPHDNTITDFTDGFSDIREGIIRIIGDPATRYREDPLRLLRVVRFAAKLNFLIDTSTRAPIKQHGKDLR